MKLRRARDGDNAGVFRVREDLAATTGEAEMTRIRVRAPRSVLVCAATFGLVACATDSADGNAEYGEARWAANGWLSPDRSGEPEIIGLFTTRDACEAALDEWLAQQVVGAPISGVCLPVDRH